GSLGKLVAGSLSLAGRWQKQQLRRLNVHEYQGAELMSKYGVNVPKGVAVSSVEEVKEAVISVFPNEKEVYLCQKLSLVNEMYFAITLDRKTAGPVSPKVADRSASIEQVKKLYQLFCECDCTLLEINPIAETSDNQLVAADAKLNFDDNAAFRQKEIFALRDPSQEDPREV
ncbi:hypothetical protein BHE74_00022089, partial [Ensete ventricosum]